MRRYVLTERCYSTRTSVIYAESEQEAWRAIGRNEHAMLDEERDGCNVISLAEEHEDE